MLASRKRPSLTTVDLQDLKQPWLAWCKSQNAKSSDLIKRFVATCLANDKRSVAKGKIQYAEPEAASVRINLCLTPSEVKLLKNQAESAGLSSTKWLVALVRTKLTDVPHFGQDELEALASSNRQMLALGRNLNQIAKALNGSSSAAPETVSRLEDLEASVATHVKTVSALMSANVQRWKIDE